MNTDDRDLKDAFDALGRKQDVTELSFEQLTSCEALTAARARRRRRWATQASVAVLGVAILALGVRTNDTIDFERFTALTGIDLNEVTWEAPSDFLLEFPGRDLLRQVPLPDVQAPALAPDSARPPDSNDIKRRPRS